MPANTFPAKVSHGEEETRAFGERLGGLLRQGDVVLLNGDLGTGKTCLAQGIARGLGVGQVVSSPSYVLMNEYEGRVRMYHVDLYRLSGVEEMDELGLWDYAERGVLVIEWPERGAELLPGDGLQVDLSHGANPNERILRLQPRGARGEELARAAGGTS